MQLRTARRIARLSRDQLAERAAVPPDVLADLETGKRDINDLAYRSVVHLAWALGAEPLELFPVAPLLPVLPRLIDPPLPEVRDVDH